MKSASIQIWLWAAIVSSSAASSNATNSSLPDLALQYVLQRAAPIAGIYSACSAPICNWMGTVPDSTKLVDLNVPGTHDTATWNYTQATQDSLAGITNSSLQGGPGFAPFSAIVYRTQNVSILDSFNIGIRALDLRIGLDPTNTSIVFHHSKALLSETATLQDVLIAIYYWLSQHPTETIFMSINAESSTTEYASFDESQQQMVYDILTNDLAVQFFDQTKSSFGTLGDVRGKIVFLRRFTLDNPTLASSIQGSWFDANQWTDDSPNITLVFDNTTGAQGVAYIEDFYEPDSLPYNSTVSTVVTYKLNATTAHLELAANATKGDSLYWTFASAEYDIASIYPQYVAVGNQSEVGVNQQLLPFLQSRNGSRLGIVMMDFVGSVSGLIEAVISGQGHL